MPEEKNVPSPVISAADWDAIRQSTPREVAAARLVASRHTGGLYRRAYLAGDSDHAPILKATAAFTAKVYDLLDALPGATGNPEAIEKAAAVRAAMEDLEL